MLKLFAPLLIGLLAVLLTSCASNQDVLLDVVGPAGRTRLADANEGTLIVYSAWEGSIDDTEHMHHAPYTICSDSGGVIKTIRNWNGGILGDPTPCALTEGIYQIKAHAQGYGTVTVPVRIEAKRATSVYLDDTTASSAGDLDRSDAVTLPDGRIVGWRAGPVR